MFRSRTNKLVPSSSASPEVTDCCFHGFVAKKFRKSQKIIVIESLDPLLTVGTISKGVNGILTNNLTIISLAKMFASRTRKVVPGIISHDIQSNSSIDAKNYSKTYDELTMFCTCAICGEEGPPKDLFELADYLNLIDNSNIKLL